MAQYRVPDPEELIECPYDRVHMVRAKRFQYHLVKCRKNYTGTEFMKCPFNAKHHVPKPEFRHHIANCPDKAIMEPELSYSSREDNVDRVKGCTDTPVYRDIEIPTQEDWDSEISAPVRRGPAYDSEYYERVKFKDITGLSKSQKAMLNDHRLSNEEKMQQFGEKTLYSRTEDISLRRPMAPSLVAMGNAPPTVASVPPVLPSAYAMGRGRGRGIAAVGMQNGAPGLPSGQFGRGTVMPQSTAGMTFTPGVGRGHIAPPPGYCVPKVTPSDY